MPQHLSALAEFSLGAATGLIDCVLFHWIDTLKVRRQDNRPLLMDPQTGKSLSRTSRGFAFSAVRSLYAGFSTNLSLKLPYMACMFAFNALNTRLLEGVAGAGMSKPATELAAAALVGCGAVVEFLRGCVSAFGSRLQGSGSNGHRHVWYLR